MVQLLLLKGADKDSLNNNLDTPLHLAVLRDQAATALALLAAGADFSFSPPHGRWSIVHFVAKRGTIDILRAVIERGADIQAANSYQETALHVAALHDRVEAIDVLVEAGANIEARSVEGFTPLHEAAYQPNPEASLALLKHGADVNAQNGDQETPLHLAAGVAGLNTAELVDSLLRSGADETTLDWKGKAAADVVGNRVEERESLAEDVDRVRGLLANAPADRAWRRRGYLVLCRARPGRLRQMQDTSRVNAGMARRTRSRAKLGGAEVSSCSGAVEASPVGDRGGGDWAGVVEKVLVLQEEGIFRTIVGYL